VKSLVDGKIKSTLNEFELANFIWEIGEEGVGVAIANHVLR
jgi:hypothetical protein